MVKKKKAKKASSQRPLIIDATLKTAAQKKWGEVTLGDIAKNAKISVVDVQKFFLNRDDILPAIVETFDAQVERIVGKSLTMGKPEDRLFEVIMARFDILQTHRPAILSILNSLRQNPSSLRQLLPAQMKSMQNMLRIAGLVQDEPKNTMSAFGLGAIYAASLYSWQKDESKDMTATMAALDRHIKRAGKLAEILFQKF